MTTAMALPLGALLASLLASVVIFMLPERRHGWRIAVNLSAASLKLTLVCLMIWGVFQGREYGLRFAVLPDLDFVLRADALAMMFAGLSSLLWLFTTVYAVGYLEDSPNRSRFFGFFSLCVASTLGIALAGNLFTFFVFYEMLTLSTYPLVVHRGTPEALSAGRKYLVYTLTGGAVLLLGIVWLHSLAGDLAFQPQGHSELLAHRDSGALVAIFALLFAGLGVKAAVVPLHGWLPAAMVAPAPVSALLHAVAVVKAGAFGMVRVLYHVFGIEFSAALGLLGPVAGVAAFTILYGSVRALFQTDLKRRLAFSTISQVAYIPLGLSLLGPVGTAGGLVHLLHQGLMKITLFFCAGNYAESLRVHRIDALNGAGQRMPATSIAFTLGAFGMMGAPPLAGFVTKWTLGTGALAADMGWVIGVLVASSLLNAAYFLPIVHRLWFREAEAPWPREHHHEGRLETSPWLLWPPLFTAASILVVGLLAAVPFSPLSWAQLVAAPEFAP